jgi:hypothetical protein
MYGRLGTLKCMVTIYRSRKRKGRHKVTVLNHDKVNLKINEIKFK